MKKFKWVEHPIPLVFKRDELLAYEFNINCKVPRPILSISKEFLILSNSFVIIRNLFLIPALISVLYLCTAEIQDIYKSWKASEKSTIHFIEFRKNKYGSDYFDTLPENKKYRDIILYEYNRLNNEGELTFNQYITDRHGSFVAYGERNYRHDRNSIIFFGTTIPLLLIWVIGFKRRAPLIFDRKRRLLYTWSKGKVVAQRYDNLRALETPSFLAIMLRATVKKGKLGWGRFSVTPQGNTIYNSKDSYQQVLAYIVQFMEYGREHVMPEQTEWQGRKGFFLFEDKKPHDFEEQLAVLLVRIDAATDEVEFDEDGQLVES
ncbi:hypothetical protein PE36_12147 [Moritella sp. PE36]|uniref:hypothetical protein n=1 Tax=Moritella sp. PE36 TaxID=58051 RepID=UPI0001568B46|nr:hypothetical protein [Moritella sp. PE36]EDM65983.1 hypothetical protein PE36_12147 [Moritella sp. PE36]